MRGLGPTLLRDVPFSGRLLPISVLLPLAGSLHVLLLAGIYWFGYEFLKSEFLKLRSQRDLPIWEAFISGAMSGTVSPLLLGLDHWWYFAPNGILCFFIRLQLFWPYHLMSSRHTGRLNLAKRKYWRVNIFQYFVFTIELIAYFPLFSLWRLPIHDRFLHMQYNSSCHFCRENQSNIHLETHAPALHPERHYQSFCRYICLITVLIMIPLSHWWPISDIYFPLSRDCTSCCQSGSCVCNHDQLIWILQTLLWALQPEPPFPWSIMSWCPFLEVLPVVAGFLIGLRVADLIM